jgi:hypothetical protein
MYFGFRRGIHLKGQSCTVREQNCLHIQFVKYLLDIYIYIYIYIFYSTVVVQYILFLKYATKVTHLRTEWVKFSIHKI